jgi:hypothetical protein
MEMTGPPSFVATGGVAVDDAEVATGTLATDVEVAGEGLAFLESHAGNKVSPRTTRVAGVLVMAAECTPKAGSLFPVSIARVIGVANQPTSV